MLNFEYPNTDLPSHHIDEQPPPLNEQPPPLNERPPPSLNERPPPPSMNGLSTNGLLPTNGLPLPQ